MRRWRRRFWTGLLLLLVIALAVPLSLPLWARAALQAALARSLGRPVRVEAVRVRWLPLELDIRNVRVDGATAAAAPFFESPRVVIRAGLGSLWSGGRVLSRVDLHRPTLRINAFPEGGDDIPRGRTGGAGPSLVSIRRLTVESGDLVLNHRRIPLALSLSDLEGQLRRGSDGALSGTISFSRGTLAEGDSPALAIAATLDLSLANAILTVRQGDLRTPRSHLAISGSVRLLVGPIGVLALRGPVDLEELDTHVWRTGLGIRGNGRYEGRLTVAGPQLVLSGRLSGTQGVFNRVAVPDYSGELRWDAHGFLLRALSVRTLGGQATIDFAYPPAPEPTRLRATYQGVDAESAIRAIFDLGPIGLASSATGVADLNWPRGRTRALSGQITFDLADRSDARPPVRGRFEWQATNGRQDIRRAVLQTPATALRLAGTIDPHNHVAFVLDGDSSDLAWTDEVGMRLRQALGNAEARVFGFSGRGSFRGRCSGTLSVPLFDGTFSGRDFGFLGVRWGRADWVGDASPNDVHCRSLVLRRDHREFWLDGWLETGDYAGRDRFDLTLRSKEWPLEDIAMALQWDIVAHGLMTASGTIRGRRSEPSGEVHATIGHGDIYGVFFEDLRTDLALRGRVREVVSAHARVGRGDLTLQGALTDDDTYDVTANVHDIDLRDLLPARGRWPGWAGQVSGDLAFQGTVARPWVQGRLASPGISWGGVDLGPASLNLAGPGQPTLGLAVACQSERFDARLDGHAGTLPPFPSDLRLTLHDTALDPIVRLFSPGLPVEVGLTTDGTFSLTGPLLHMQRAAVDVDLADLKVLLPDYPLHNLYPVTASVRAGQLRIDEAQLAGEGTRLTVSGTSDLVGQGPMAVNVSGDADLRALSVWTDRVKGRGAVRLELSLVGSRRKPRIEGRLDITGGGLRLRGFPHGLEDIAGTIVFTEGGAHIKSLRAALGGGTLEADGDATFSGARLASFDVHPVGHGIRLRYPEGLRSLLDADLRVTGDSERQWVSGDVLLHEALWTRRYDVSSELLAVGSSPLAREEAVGPSVSYDVHLHAPGTLRVDNNLAALVARADDLNLVGTLDNPILLGSADIESGRVYFHGNTYVLRRGNIDFNNRQRMDPFFNIEAETAVRGYRVVLSAVGTLERVNPTLTSDPPLSPLQILSLLAGADDGALTSLAQAQRDQTYLAATGAATLAAGRLSEQIGLERGAQRLFGLNRFSIDPRTINTINPALAEGELSTAARLTIGKRITPDLSVLYSQDLGGKEERLLSGELTLSNSFSLLFSYDHVGAESGEFGSDVLYRYSR